jgi:hypothetical protein
MTVSFLHTLDKSNFFYDTIVTLAYSQFGIDELYSRGFMTFKLKQFPDRNDFINDINQYNFPQGVKDQIFRTRTFTPLIFVPGFQTKDANRVYQMEPNYSAVHFIQDTGGRTKANLELTHMTTIVAWEKAIAFNLADTPVLQFFRHIRNAAAHNGKFHFTKNALDSKTGELIKEAKWRTFEIKASFQGSTLILVDKNDQNSFWDQGDLVEFLLDFENHYTELKGTQFNP